MQPWQEMFLLFFALFNLAGAGVALHKTKNKKSAYGRVPQFFLISGAFVWADLVVFGTFWTIVAFASLLLKDWLLFLLFVSVFWLIRSTGEWIYWFLQQFSNINRNPPENSSLYKIFQNSSVWFVYQIYWQTITVTTIITTLYLAALWITQVI